MFNTEPDNRDDGERFEPEAEWPGELPDHDEDWIVFWFNQTCSAISYGVGPWFCQAMVEEHHQQAA